MSNTVHFAKCMQKITHTPLWFPISGSSTFELCGWLVRHTFIHFVTTIHFNSLTFSLIRRREWASHVLKLSFTATITWQNNILSGTAWCVVAFISLAMLFSHVDGYMVEKGSACPGRQRCMAITVLLCAVCSSVSRSACPSKLCASHPGILSTPEL